MSEISKRPDAYVGVSGVVEPSQQRTIEAFAAEAGLWTHDRRLALGVKAVHKTQFLDVENKYGKEWYPVGRESFEGALVPRVQGSSTLGVAQTFFDPGYIDNPGYREYFRDRIFQRGEAWIDGIQFDMLPWHNNPDMEGFLQDLRLKYETKVFLQCHKDAMDSLGPEGVVERLKELAPLVDYVLFDSSHGTGTRLDVDRLHAFLSVAYESGDLDTVGFAIAGGLNGDVVREELPKIMEDFPDISWDAEGQLHSETDKRTMPLDMEVVRNYLQASVDIVL